MPHEFTSFDPSFFNYIATSICNYTPSIDSSKEKIAGENFDEVIFGNFKSTLRDILEPKEFETLIRRECLEEQETFEEIAEELNIRGKSGSAHQIYNRALKKCRIHFAIEVIHQHAKKEAGCTLYPINLRLTGFTGFAVSRDEGRETFSKCPTKGEIKKYIKKHQKVFNFENDNTRDTTLHVGISKYGNIWLLEQNHIYEDYAMANARATLESQKTMYDFKHDHTIDVQIPPYPEPK